MLQKSSAWYCRWVNKRFGLKPSEPDSIMQKELRVYLVRFPLVSWGTWLGFTRSGWEWPETLGCRKSRGFSPGQVGEPDSSFTWSGWEWLGFTWSGWEWQAPPFDFFCSLFSPSSFPPPPLLFSLFFESWQNMHTMRRVDLKSCKQNKIFCNFIHISVLNFLTHDIHLMI